MLQFFSPAIFFFRHLFFAAHIFIYFALALSPYLSLSLSVGELKVASAQGVVAGRVFCAASAAADF